MEAAMESRFVTIAGIRLHYQEAGRGQPVICIHGAGPGSNAPMSFAPNVEPLSRHFRIILYDMPQFGKSEKVVLTEGRLQFNARILKGFVAALDLGKTHIIGNSVGGQVGLKFGLDFPELLDRLIILGSGAMPPLFAPYPVEGVKLINAYYKGSGPSREKLRDLMATNVYDASILSEETLEARFQASIDPETVELFGKKQRDLPRENLGPDLPRLKAKLLTVWGMDDRMGALDVGLQITRLVPNSQMHIFSRCGHYPQIEHAAAFNRLAIDFLAN